MSPTTTTQPDPPYVDGSGMIQVPGLTIDRIHENFEGIEPNPPGLLDHLLGIDPTPVAPSGTSPWFWLATAAAVLVTVAVAVGLAGCGSSSTTEFTTPTTAASPTLITHTSRVPKVVSPDPVPVEVPVKYNGQMAVRYAAWVDARAWCDTSGRGDSCARLADEKFSDVAYNVRAREEYLKRGTYETRWSTPPAATSYSTTTSVETVRPTRPGSAPSSGGKFAGMTPVLVGSGVGALVLIGLALAFLTRRRGGYRPAHTASYGGGERSYGQGYRFDDDLNTDFGDDADDY